MNTPTIRFDPTRLREARGDRRREEIAVVVGVSTYTIENWGGGRSEPNATPLAMLASYLCRPLEFFFTEAA